jgi:hypothetical protein
MAEAYYTYDEARRHKYAWSGVWASAIWVDDAGDQKLAVIHWMGGGYKVVGRYSADEVEQAKGHAERCSKSGYCPTTPDDSGGFSKHLEQST